MTNFNPINNNLFIKFQNNISQKPADLVNADVQSENPAVSGQSSAQNISYDKLNPSLMFDYNLVKMDSETMLKYLQNLMNLPDSIEKFISQANDKNSKTFNILIENLISLSELNKFLNENSSQAIQKLMQTMTQSLKSGLGDTKQLRDILSILTLLQAKSETNINTLREFLLLYIPLNYPIFEKNGNYNSIEKKHAEEIKKSTLSILFETVNFSNILCTANEYNNIVYIELYANGEFEDEKFFSTMERFSKDANIKISVEIRKQEEKIKTSYQNFKIISEGFIPPKILILAHIIIKTVFLIDNSFE